MLGPQKNYTIPYNSYFVILQDDDYVCGSVVLDEKMKVLDNGELKVSLIDT